MAAGDRQLHLDHKGYGEHVGLRRAAEIARRRGTLPGPAAPEKVSERLGLFDGPERRCEGCKRWLLARYFYRASDPWCAVCTKYRDDAPTQPPAGVMRRKRGGNERG